MKVSLSWLKNYLPGEYDIQQLADSLTMVGLEVDAVTERYAYLDSVIVGRIDAVTAHPNADRLTCCQVDTGNGHVPVVCGAPNTNKGLLVPLALPGTVFPDGFVLEKTTIRGETSEGMLCSQAELGLGSDADGLMILDSGYPVGKPVNQVLGLFDPVLEIDLTPNRADCLSILGICREIAAINNTKARYPDVPDPIPGNAINQITSVVIKAPSLCPRYAARVLTDITVGPSPFWLQDRLRSVGLRPVNNVVDITNFVMMETGQPLHAFDFDCLAEHRIVVRTAKEGDHFTTLDGQTRQLNDDTLMICDGEKQVAVAGVMGGLNSEIEDTTTRVLIESACFNPASIRRTAKGFNLGSDASYRFERGVDPGGTVRAMERAAHLMVEICEGKWVDGIIDAHPGPVTRNPIELSVDRTNRVLGTDLTGKQMSDILQSIEFNVQPSDIDNHLAILPPSFRVDISRPEDLMEEVARLHGYNRIPTTFPAITDSHAISSPIISFRERVKALMTGFGFVEVIAYSFNAENDYDRLGLSIDDPRRRFVTLLNPLTESQTVMRTSLVPGLLDTVRYNVSRQTRNIRLFEIGQTFIAKTANSLPKEKEIISGLWTGNRMENTWHGRYISCDFYDLKGVAEGLLSALHIDETRFTRFKPERSPYYKTGMAAEIFSGESLIGVIGEISMPVLKAFDISQPLFLFELDAATLLDLTPSTQRARPLPRYPAISRDMTIIVSKEIEGLTLKTHLTRLNEPLVESIDLVDVFEGRQIPAGKKSLSFRITYRSGTETLVDDTINDIHQRMTHCLVKDFDAGLPT
ncbi:MAG: phenylalanine--tRNA ligase subunit beta [Thermodesulfobacteriota bacterium]|nr:phenylalanine--tRNA ligase subunit beta [Thermodesulfobacteriota bacterium]